MYTWIVVVGGAFSFFAAIGIGANDVANAYATSVGSKALNMKQAVVLACVFETSGAIFMGSHVTQTIRKGIADYECFEDDPGALMYGCMWVCLSVGMWLLVASKYEMPVSTTHSCVGGMIGMTIAAKGVRCVTWYEDKDTFPFIGGVSGIVLSWIISPVFSGLISSSLFWVIRQFILRKENSYDRTTILFPLLIGSTVTLNTFFIIYKGAKGLGLDDTTLGVACAWSFGTGAVVGVGVLPFRDRIKSIVNKRMETIQQDSIVELENVEEKKDKGCFSILTNHVKENLKVDLNEIVEQDMVAHEIHDAAEVFEDKTEEYFKFLQIFTAMCDSFAHGANDVANAIGPFVAIYMIGKENKVNDENEVGNSAYWILGMGGAGISLGLLLYGYKIIQAIGLKLCKITPSRGVAIELASAVVIISGSRLEIPLSTTHCQIGATVGVAALENPVECTGLNMKVMMKTVAGWILTLVIVGSTTAILTAQGVHSPEVGVDKCETFNKTEF